jgi:APA family basic amino acid/polyamine antiporter
MHENDTNHQLADSSQALLEKMPAEFGLGMAIFVVLASMVGVGVLTTSGYTVALVGSNQLMLGLWVVGGVIAVSGALTLAELSSTLPHTGGDYVYLYEAYGPLAAFLSGWVSFLIGFSGPSAASAFASAKYLLIPVGMEGDTAVLAQRSLATVAVLVFTLIHVSGRKRTARVQGVITALKMALLVLFILAGLAAGWPHSANLQDPKTVDADLAVTMLFSLVYIYYAYTGWNGASYLAGEIRDAQRILPRAILLGTGLVTLLYLAMNLVYAFALSADQVQAIVRAPENTQGLDAVAPIAEIAAQRLFGPRWSNPLSVAIGLMLFSTLSAYLLLGPRVLYAMAQAGQFPSLAARLTRGAGTPGSATVFQVGITLFLLWTGSFESIVVYASVGLSIFSILSMSSIFILRWRRPELPRPFRTPGYPVTPAVYLLLTSMLTAAAFALRPRVSAAALVSILIGVPVYYLWRWGKPPQPRTIVGAGPRSDL